MRIWSRELWILARSNHIPPMLSTYQNLIATSGIIVPQINTAKEAEAVVAAAKFPPLGRRGQGSPFSALAHGVDLPTYIKVANETLLTCVQIETKEGVENVDAICAVPGIGE